MTESKFTAHAHKPKTKIAWGRVALFILVIALLIALIANLGKVKNMLGLGVDDSYYAVFLNNNEVYFGKITARDSVKLSLSNVYYLNAGATASSSSLQLVKLGQEVHGPTDEMFIPNTSITFYERLREDSAVAKHMREAK